MKAAAREAGDPSRGERSALRWWMLAGVWLIYMCFGLTASSLAPLVGPIIGAYFLTFLLEYLRPIIPGTERYFVYGLIALIVYVLEPKGLYSIIQKLYGRFFARRET